MKQILLLVSLFACTMAYASNANLSKTNSEQLFSIFNYTTTKILSGTGTDVCSNALLIIDDNPIPDGTYDAFFVATKGEVSVPANGDVTFKGGNKIFLDPGFHAMAGSSFSAVIEECLNPLEEDETVVANETSRVAKNTSQTTANSLFKKHDLAIYPNPFSYTTTVDFQIFEAQKAHLAIYSATQQLVQVLENGNTMNKGNYRYEISGANLEAGMYFVVLQTETGTLTKKLILVK